MSLKDIIAPLAVWKRVLEKPYTVKKPIDERPGSDRYRGFHKNDTEQCIGCGTCSTICQNAAIDMVKVEGVEANAGDSGLRPKIDYGRCCWCALCVDMCTTSSLSMSNEYIWIDEDPEVFRFVPGLDEKPWNNMEKGYSRPDGYKLLNPNRVPIKSLSFDEGVKSFTEMIKGYSKEEAIREADRCVECGICITNCPAHMDIPEYIKAIRDDNMNEGLELLYRTNPFPASCGRVCTHRCEDVCAIGHTGEPISIRWLKRFIADQVELNEYSTVLPQPLPDNGKNIAVIGGGPGGLSAAYYLRLLGYSVKVFEANESAGGMLRYGIPEYRLPYDQLDKDIKYIENLGVEIVTNTEINDAKEFKSMYNDYDAIFFSTGLNQPYTLGIEGEDHPRCLAGLDVLDDVTKGKDPGVGKKVAVIGGGNVAMDAARTSRRYGADVTLLYRRRIEDMPADPEEIHESQEEDVKFITQAIPVSIKDGRNGKVVFVWGEAKMVEEEGKSRPTPVLQEDKIHELEVDSIISAIGQGSNLNFLPDESESGIEIKRYKVVVNKSGQTTDAKVFAGGDIVNSRKDAISAIADGQRAAKAIDLYCKGGTK